MAGRAAGAEKSGIFPPNRQTKAGVPRCGGRLFSFVHRAQAQGTSCRPSLAAFSPDIRAAAARKPFDTRRPNRIPLSGFCLVPPPAAIPFGDLRQPFARFSQNRISMKKSIEAK